MPYGIKSYTSSFGLLSSDIGYGAGCGGLCYINYTVTGYDIPYLSGQIVNNAEGIYYWDMYRVAANTYGPDCGGNGWYSCSATNWYQDSPYYESMKRFMVAVRLKFVINDLNIDPPTVIQDIPDQTPIVGMTKYGGAASS